VEALRPDETDAATLQEQLRRLVAEAETTCRETRITLDLDEATHPLHPDLCLALYRCAGGAHQYSQACTRDQSAAAPLHSRWAGGTRQCWTTARCASQIHEQQAPGFGLGGMRERVELLSGRL